VSYQLILKNCHVLDPGGGIDGRADIAISDGRGRVPENHASHQVPTFTAHPTENSS